MKTVQNYYHEDDDNIESSTAVLNQISLTKCAECDESSTAALKKCIRSKIQDAKKHLEKQGNKMKAFSTLKFLLCFVGDTVRLKIVDIDRGRDEFGKVFMAVVESTDNGFYKPRNERGTIEEMFTRNSFSVCGEKLVVLRNVQLTNNHFQGVSVIKDVSVKLKAGQTNINVKVIGIVAILSAYFILTNSSTLFCTFYFSYPFLSFLA